MMEYILSSMKVHLASVYEKILSSVGVNLSGSKVNLSSGEVGLSNSNLSSEEVGLSSSKINLSGSEVNLSSSKINLSSSNLSSSKVNLSSSKVNLSKILILKSIVCWMCVMFSSDVSWGMENKKKVVLLGDNNVGKTQIVNQKIYNKFDGTYTETAGAKYNSLRVGIPKEEHTQNIKLEIWDAGGREKYTKLLIFNLKGVDAFVLVYDITDKKSFKNIPTWIKLAQDNADKEAVYFLVGNKTDLNDERKVETDNARKFADDNNMIFLEVSAKTGDNIKELFEGIAKKCVEKFLLGKPNDDPFQDNDFLLFYNIPNNFSTDTSDHKKTTNSDKRCSCCPCYKDKKE